MTEAFGWLNDYKSEVETMETYNKNNGNYPGTGKQWTIGKKLIAGFAAVAAVILIVGGIGVYSTITANKSIHTIGDVRLPSVESLGTMNYAYTYINLMERQLGNRYLSRNERRDRNEQIKNAWEIYRNAKSTYDTLDKNQQERVLYDEYISSFNSWKAGHDTFMAMSAEFDLHVDNEEKSEQLLEEMYELAGTVNIPKFRETADELMALRHSKSNHAAQEVASAYSTLSILKTVSIFGLILGVGMALFLGYRITQSINNALGSLILKLSSGSSQVDAASRQLSEASQEMAEGASEQAASLEETTSSLEEMSSQTKQTAQNATSAERSMKETQPLVDGGVEAMRRMNKAMGEINEASTETSKIIKTIDDIAFQTNLLALNAAVEAARAGEAGKGFAVVAEEVRNLAQRSAKAAQGTSDLIQKSQNSAERGISVAEEVSGNLEKIAQGVKNVSTLIVEISAATSEQATGIQQMSSAMSEMDRAVQNNASGSEESASAAEELSSQSADLKNMVDELIQLIGNEHDKTFKPDSFLNSVKNNGMKKPNYSVEKSSRNGNGHVTKKKPKLNGRYNNISHNERNGHLIPLDDDDFSDF